MRWTEGLFTFDGKLVLATLSIIVLAAGLLGGNLGSAQLRAQTGDDSSLPSFEVASIKLNKSPTPLPGGHFFGDRFIGTGPAIAWIEGAYGSEGHPLAHNQVSGGPDWIRSLVFDINAKVDDSLVEGDWKKLSFEQEWNQIDLMIRSLLLDRFKLEVRHETKEVPVYALVVAKNGPKFAEDYKSQKGVRALGHNKLQVTSSLLSDFLFLVSRQPELGGRVVVDKTALKGRYSFTFEWTPDSLATGNSHLADGSASPNSTAPSLFTALREQLGLRLESTKAPVDTIYIEHIEQPSEN